MKIIKESSASFDKSVLILGFFDGIHLGHKDVICASVKYAKENNTHTIMLTFPKSPAEYFCKNTEYIYPYPRTKSYEIIEQLGVDYLVEQDFPNIMNLSPEKYIEKITAQYKPTAIFSGFNYTFGKEKSGNSKTLQKFTEKYGYEYFEIPADEISGQIISSTYIKILLQKGLINEANQLFTSPFEITGEVIKGLQIGRTIGFPTANIKYPQNTVKIPYGVYKAEVFGKKAIANFGIRPTFEGREECLEVHIPNFDGDLYGQVIDVKILDKIRGEIKFNNQEELRIQIKKDVEECLK